MAKSLTIEFTTEFEKVKTDLSNCLSCDDVIYSDMNNMILRFRDNDIRKTDIYLCDSCKDIFDKN